MKDKLGNIAKGTLLAIMLFQSGLANALTETDHIALTVYYEAGGESVYGQILVIWTILNRVDDPRFPNTIEDVVSQDSQYLGYLNNSKKLPANNTFTNIKKLVQKILKGKLGPDPSHNALWFHNTNITKPRSWSSDITFSQQVGRHIFYSDKEEWR